MDKIRKKCRMYFFAASYGRLFFLAAVAASALLMAYFSQKIVFFDTDTTAAAYTIDFVTVQEELPEKAPIEIRYDGEQICLLTDGSVEKDKIAVYASSRFGVARLTEANRKQLDEVFLGSFAAAYPKQMYDIDGDGQDENVYYFIKTDLRSIQQNAGTTPLMRDKNVAIEIGMDSFERLFVYYQMKPLVAREVTVYLGDGTSFACMTDEAGYLPAMTVKQMRAGVTVEYAPNGLNTYIARYVPETNRILSAALYPAAAVLLLALAVIILCVLLRRWFSMRSGRRDYTIRSGARRTYKPGFVIVRWIVMIVSFLLLTWGGSWLGYWFEELYLPVLSCSKYNQEQIVASSCYYMSHLKALFTLPPEKIAVFFVCFFLPLLVFGRLFCGFVCPMGLVQDVLHAARQKTGIQGVSLTDQLYERLAVIKWTAVMLFLGMSFAGLDFCNVCPAVTLSPAFSGFKTTIYISGFVMVFVLAASFFKVRFFCNICPLGLLMGIFHKFTFVRLKKDGTACTECGACYNACPMGIKSVYTEREHQDVTDTNCIMCGECIRSCPEDQALQMTLAGMPLYTSSRADFMKRFQPKKEDTE